MLEYFVPFRALLTLWEANLFIMTLCSCLSFSLSPCHLPQTHVQVIRAFISRLISLFLIHLPTNCTGVSDNCLSLVTVTNTK